MQTTTPNIVYKELYFILTMIIAETIHCPECNSTNNITDYVRAEIFCNNCGLVLEESIIENKPDWSSYTPEDGINKNRIGAPLTLTLHDKGLSTNIGKYDKDHNGNSLKTKEKSKFYRLRKLDTKTKISTNKDKYLFNALIKLDQMSSSLDLPKNVQENAAYIYRKTVNMKSLKGRSSIGILAAALYASCKMYHIPRTLSEISNISKIPEKNIGRYYKFLNKLMKFKIQPPSPYNYLNRFCNELNLGSDVVSKSQQILKKADQKDMIKGRNPIICAAASIYLASILCKTRRTQSQIAEVAGITELGLRNVYKKIQIT
jgi:transcription initiation factor TFIIB